VAKLVVLVTGRIAEAMVRAVAKELRERLGLETHVLVLPIAVAVLATPRIVEHHLLREFGPRLRDVVEVVIVPGGVRWSCSELSKRLGIRVVKGTKHIDDLVDAIEELGIEGLSPDVPADELARNVGLRKAREALRLCEQEARVAFSVCGTRIPVRPPPFRIVAEVLDAWRRKLDDVVEESARFLESGASIVSLDLHGASPSDAKAIVSKVVSRLGRPVAVDAPPRVAVGACLGGAEMIMNVDADSVEKLWGLPRDVAVTIVPSILGESPGDPARRIELIARGVDRARRIGIEKLLVDPILDPPISGSILDSLVAYREASRRFPRAPMVMGVANVVELYDADSVGLNAALALLALEVGASVLLTVEASRKSMGSVRELSIATAMLSVARRLGRPPKDLGISLLLLKEKRSREAPLPQPNEYQQRIEVPKHPDSWELDPLGVFRVFVDRARSRVCALYIGRKGRLLLCSRTARDLLLEIVSRGLVSRLDHAAYLGRELAKAEEALRIGRSYVQDEPLFPEVDSLVRRLSIDEEGSGEDGS